MESVRFLGWCALFILAFIILKLIHHVLGDTEMTGSLWSIAGLISMVGAIILEKIRKLEKKGEISE